jgi:hypothetical protein
MYRDGKLPEVLGGDILGVYSAFVDRSFRARIVITDLEIKRLS